MLAGPTAFGTIYARFLRDLPTFEETGGEKHGVPHSCKATSGGGHIDRIRRISVASSHGRSEAYPTDKSFVRRIRSLFSSKALLYPPPPIGSEETEVRE